MNDDIFSRLHASINCFYSQYEICIWDLIIDFRFFLQHIYLICIVTNITNTTLGFLRFYSKCLSMPITWYKLYNISICLLFSYFKFINAKYLKKNNNFFILKNKYSYFILLFQILIKKHSFNTHTLEYNALCMVYKVISQVFIQVNCKRYFSILKTMKIRLRPILPENNLEVFMFKSLG